MKRLFVFFGCSWTYGKYLNWQNFVNDPQHFDSTIEHEQAELHSYRSKITQHFNATQINFSEGGSSNDRQFRFADEFFLGVYNTQDLANIERNYNNVKDLSWPGTDQLTTEQVLECIDHRVFVPRADRLEILKHHYTDITVIWFITSFSRKELYNTSISDYENQFLTTDNNFSRFFLNDYYSPDNEIKNLSAKMLLWNSWFKSNGIKNVWADTFNHNDWPVEISNQIDFGSKYTDLMSNMCIETNLTTNDFSGYHNSEWVADESRSQDLVNAGYLNSKTLHPTQSGHELIANMVIPRLEKLI
jgi:hypothetical protein